MNGNGSSSGRTCFCTVSLVKNNTEVQVCVLASHHPMAIMVENQRIDLDALKKACTDYWKRVNHRIKAGVVTGTDDHKRTAFYEDAKAWGADICSLLMSGKTATKFWNIAKGSDVLLIIPSEAIPHVPWEALYNAARGQECFLTHCCAVVRHPPSSNASCEPEPPDASDACCDGFESDCIVCVDSVLSENETIEGLPICDVLTNAGEPTHRVNSLRVLMDRATKARVVHFICEHAKAGLRLDKEIHYGMSHSNSHRFARGTVLVLGSCRNGPRENQEVGLAASISIYSSCTVVAPLSLVTPEVCVRAVQMINSEIRNAMGPLTVGELWKNLKAGPLATPHDSQHVTPTQCFSLWYGVFGSTQALVRK
jgi:hypothetical protein